MSDHNNSAQTQTPKPNPDLKSLDRLVGEWKISGGAEGTVKFEWMEGGFFLIQHVDLRQDGLSIKGIEYIGHLQSFESPPSKEIWSRYYDSMGSTFDYVYEMDGDTLIIWAGEKGSPAYYKGTFSSDGKTCKGIYVLSTVLNFLSFTYFIKTSRFKIRARTVVFPSPS